MTTNPMYYIDAPTTISILVLQKGNISQAKYLPASLMTLYIVHASIHKDLQGH